MTTLSPADLASLHHDDRCRYHDDGEYCTCYAGVSVELDIAISERDEARAERDALAAELARLRPLAAPTWPDDERERL